MIWNLNSRENGLAGSRKLLGSAALVGVAGILSRGSLLIAFSIFSRTLSVADFASIGFFLLTLTMIAGYAGLGVGVTASKYFSVAKVDQVRARAPIQALAVITLMSALLSALVVPLVWPVITDDPLDWLFVAAIVIVVLDLLPANATIGLQLYAGALKVSLVSAFILLAGSLFAAAEASGRLALLAIVLSYGAKLLGNQLLVWRSLPVTFWWPVRIRRADLREVCAVAAPLAVTSMVAGSGAWLVGEFVRAKGSDLDYALYAVGLQWYALGVYLPSMINTVLFPLQVRAAADSVSPSSDSRLLLLRGVGLVTASAMAIFLASIPLSFVAVNLYGENFAERPWIIWAFVGGASLAAPCSVLGGYLISHNRQGTWLIFTIVWLAVLVASAAVATQFAVSLTPAAFVAANTCLLLLAIVKIWRMQSRGSMGKKDMNEMPEVK